MDETEALILELNEEGTGMSWPLYDHAMGWMTEEPEFDS
jgi:hypothetical protein